jgi:CheY-like chemotaxis protein
MTDPGSYRHIDPKRILVVHDDKLVCCVLQALLESEGYEVLAAKTGAGGIDIIRQFKRPIDLLVTDWAIPQMSGPELARECCSLGRDLRVLYVSSPYSCEESEEELNRELPGIPEKSYRADEIIEQVRRLLLVESTPYLSRIPEKFSRIAN